MVYDSMKTPMKSVSSWEDTFSPERSTVDLKKPEPSNTWPEKLDSATRLTYVYLNSYGFHTIGDCHQPNSRGLYTQYKDFSLFPKILSTVSGC